MPRTWVGSGTEMHVGTGHDRCGLRGLPRVSCTAGLRGRHGEEAVSVPGPGEAVRVRCNHTQPPSPSDLGQEDGHSDLGAATMQKPAPADLGRRPGLKAFQECPPTVTSSPKQTLGLLLFHGCQKVNRAVVTGPPLCLWSSCRLLYASWCSVPETLRSV